MAFRDQTESLRHQRRLVQEELQTLGAERARLEVALASETEDVAREARLKVGGSVAGVGLFAVIIPLIGFGVVMCDGGSSSAEMRFGRVNATTGSAPHGVGTPCTSFIHYVSDDDSSWNAQLEVICNGTTLYGGDGGGYLVCDWTDDDVAMSCHDDDFTSEGGDPKIRLNRGQGLILVEDQPPPYQVQIELTSAGRR